MNVLCTDLDNTLIYSYKHDIGPNKRCVEIYQGREISYITEKTFGQLKRVREEYRIIPVSTRTEEQYNRINLGIGPIEYALVCNGGVLLENGERDSAWYNESLKIIEPSRDEVEMGISLLEVDNRRYFELRYIDQLFVFTKCSSPDDVISDLKKVLDLKKVNVFNNGEKVYIVPVELSKGRSIKRLREKINATNIFAAGDSEFDISMITEADIGFVPAEFEAAFGKIQNAITCKNIFSDYYLEECIKRSKQ